MDPSTLAERLRGIISAPAKTTPAPVSARAYDGNAGSIEDVLGGAWRPNGGHTAFVVERRIEPEARHGRDAVGALAGRVREAAGEAPLLSGGRPARPPFVFFDLETTGLSGGAGTHAFLVGCGWFDEDDGFVTRQYLMTAFADEKPLLQAVAGELARAGALVSFNGKSFDAPVLETRYLFHRLEWVGAHLPHVDVLHPARSFWGERDTEGSAPRETRRSCSLVEIERHVLGTRRHDDVPGFEIPGRYFQFIRTGDARPLSAVLEHNRLDLLSLGALTARLLHLVSRGHDVACNAQEALALGRIYARAGFDARAREAFACAALSSPCSAMVRAEAWRALALALRRARQWDRAADCWRQLLTLGGGPRHFMREASEALAIHHEHRIRDLAAARAFALQSLEAESCLAYAGAVRHRLARIERKLEREADADGTERGATLQLED